MRTSILVWLGKFLVIVGYTRKSSEDGLEQEFNSLHAQREACEAYIASQCSEGWVLVRDRYDDGGVSGGTLARAFRWKRLLESGEFTTIAELAEREGIAPSYITRVLRLTLLAPDIVEAILDGKQGPEVTLARLLEPFPAEWTIQRQTFA